MLTLLAIVAAGFGILWIVRSNHPKAVAFREWIKSFYS